MKKHSQTLRYRRQLMIPGWGVAGQRRLKKAKVFIAGAGGLGSPAAIYLAAAGVGHLVICDNDRVDLSNLNRQILHDQTRLGMPKAQSARRSIGRLNPHVKVTAISKTLDEQSVDRLVGDAELILDCLDNFDTRLILNRCAFRKKIPLIFGGVRGLDGMISFIQTPKTCCLACLVEEVIPKEVFPIVGAVPGVIGTLQALEALKFLTGLGRNLKNRLLIFKGKDLNFKEMAVKKNPYCVVCSHTTGRGPVGRR